MMDSPLPPVLHLPTEILSGILSLVVPSIWPERCCNRKLNNSPLHATRSTCRTFRWIIDELPFWRDNEFNISQIDHFFERELGEAPDPLNVDTLLSDPHLRQCLGRKTGWYVADEFVFRALVRHIPHFGQHLRDLHLGAVFEESPNHIPDTLRDNFPILTSLDVDSSHHIHFNILPLSLRTLVLGSELTCNCDCTNNLPNLEELVFRLSLYQSLSALSFKRILPFNSQKTLQRLRFVFRTIEVDLPDFELLHQFSNLTTLHVYVMSQLAVPLEMFQSLLRSPFRLKSFQACAPQIHPVLIKALVDLLQSPVLHSLQNLQLSFNGGEEINIEDQHVYEAFIRALVELPDLEDLTLSYYLFHPDWIQQFRKSQRLRFVDWGYFRFRPIKLVGRYNHDDLERDLVAILAQSQNEKPRVTLVCQDFDRHEPHSSDGSDDDEDDDEEYEGDYDEDYPGIVDEEWGVDGW
jgi:hypothetical protein